jgi:hypothetical protein
LVPQAQPRLSPGVLLEIADYLALSVADIDFSEAGPRDYQRLARTSSFEAWLIEWGPSRSLELHDHGGAVGAVRVLAGDLVEAYTDLDRPWPLRSHRLETGDSLHIGAARVHEVWNPGPVAARSIHVYSPPLATMTYYDHRPESFLTPLRTEEAHAW